MSHEIDITDPSVPITYLLVVTVDNEYSIFYLYRTLPEYVNELRNEVFRTHANRIVIFAPLREMVGFLDKAIALLSISGPVDWVPDGEKMFPKNDRIIKFGGLKKANNNE